MNTFKPQPFQQQKQNQTQQYPAGSIVPLYFYNPWISPWPIYPIHPSQLVYNDNNNNTPIQGTSTLPGPGIEAGEKSKKEGSKTQSLIPKAKKPIWLQQESSSRNSGATISTSDDERDRFNISLPRGSVYMNIVHEVDSENDDEDNGRFDSEAEASSSWDNLNKASNYNRIQQQRDGQRRRAMMEEEDWLYQQALERDGHRQLNQQRQQQQQNYHQSRFDEYNSERDGGGQRVRFQDVGNPQSRIPVPVPVPAVDGSLKKNASDTRVCIKLKFS